jgi:hypothetical protein
MFNSPKLSLDNSVLFNNPNMSIEASNANRSAVERIERINAIPVPDDVPEEPTPEELEAERVAEEERLEAERLAAE